MADNFWLSDEQSAAIAPHLPMVHTGPERTDDRRVISGIIQQFAGGLPMARAPQRIRAVYDGLQSIQPLEPARPVAAHIRGACCVWRSTGAPDDRQFSRQGASLSERGQKRGTARPGHRSFARRPHDKNPRARRRRGPSARLSADRGIYR